MSGPPTSRCHVWRGHLSYRQAADLLEHAARIILASPAATAPR
ncbi:hypothetical protein OG225_11575 [Nocardia sp. NBC_01377]